MKVLLERSLYSYLEACIHISGIQGMCVCVCSYLQHNPTTVETISCINYVVFFLSLNTKNV